MNQTQLLDDWRGPMGGVPPLEAVNVNTLRAALSAALEEATSDYERLSGSSALGSFDDTLLALDRLGERLSKVKALYQNWCSSFGGIHWYNSERLHSSLDHISRLDFGRQLNAHSNQPR